MQEFTTEITKDAAGRSVCLLLPFSAKEVFNQPKGTIFVKGTINAIPYRSRLLSRGSGQYIMLLDKAMQKTLGFNGQPLTVSVTMAPDAPDRPSSDSRLPTVSPCGMDLLTAIQTRTSIRHYTSSPISGDVINAVIYAGMCAPTAKDKRPWHFLVIEDRDLLTELSLHNSNARMLATAACGIAVCGDSALEGTKEFLYEDCAAATQNMLLYAHALGLGAVWCGITVNSPWQKLLIQKLNLPPKTLPLTLISLGHPAAPKPPAPKWTPSKIHHNTW